MNYRRDFTIGLRETQAFYVSLVLGSWWKGIVGLGLIGGLVAWMYMNWARVTLAAPWRFWIMVAAMLATMGAIALGMALSTRSKVRAQVRRAGRESYVQQTEIDGFGVHVTVGKDRAKLSFEKLVRVQETGSAFYLFLSDSQAWLLPKAQMEDPDAECRQLRTIFRTVIESKKLKLRK